MIKVTINDLSLKTTYKHNINLKVVNYNKFRNETTDRLEKIEK